MKKSLVVLLLVLFLTGCGGSLKESEFFEHDSHYKNFDHLLFSWFGYRAPSMEDAQNSKADDWWGIEIDQTGR